MLEDAMIDTSVYPPLDDSFLLLEAVKEAAGDVLDMCAGSGLVGIEAARRAKSVTLVDINPEAVSHIRKVIKDLDIANARAVISDLFSGLKDAMFDTIYINPPYLPERSEKKDYLNIATIGGEHGYELTLRFLKEAPGHLKGGGRMFIILSTVYDLNKVYDTIKSIGFDFSVLKSKKFFFEELLLIEVYESGRSGISR